MRDTEYATEITTAADVAGQSIERIFEKDSLRPEARFSYWPHGKMAFRPLDIPGDALHPAGSERAVWFET